MFVSCDCLLSSNGCGYNTAAFLLYTRADVESPRGGVEGFI